MHNSLSTGRFDRSSKGRPIHDEIPTALHHPPADSTIGVATRPGQAPFAASSGIRTTRLRGFHSAENPPDAFTVIAFGDHTLRALAAGSIVRSKVMLIA